MQEVLTDNGSCYRSRTFEAALGDIAHRGPGLIDPRPMGKSVSMIGRRSNGADLTQVKV